MFRSTTSSGTKRFDAGHRAERIFVSGLFACPASAPRNVRGIGDLSTILQTVMLEILWYNRGTWRLKDKTNINPTYRMKLVYFTQMQFDHRKSR